MVYICRCRREDSAKKNAISVGLRDGNVVKPTRRADAMEMNCLGLPREGERPGTCYAFLGFRIVYVGAKHRKATQSNAQQSKTTLCKTMHKEQCFTTFIVTALKLCC